MACRGVSEKSSLVRVVRGADGAIRLDPTGKAPGRGAYVCPSAECVTKALKQRKFDRALKAHVPATLPEQLETMTARPQEKT